MTVTAEVRVRIVNPQGLHARPISQFVQLAGTFSVAVTVKGPGGEADGCSVLGMMTLQGAQGSDLEIRAEGSDAEAAVEALRGLVANGFGEM
jgi:phosphocarrier protein HPr